jgi:hypothetical protein
VDTSETAETVFISFEMKGLKGYYAAFGVGLKGRRTASALPGLTPLAAALSFGFRPALRPSGSAGLRSGRNPKETATAKATPTTKHSQRGHF